MCFRRREIAAEEEALTVEATQSEGRQRNNWVRFAIYLSALPVPPSPPAPLGLFASAPMLKPDARALGLIGWDELNAR